jgi:hypothetical protein
MQFPTAFGRPKSYWLIFLGPERGSSLGPPRKRGERRVGEGIFQSLH